MKILALDTSMEACSAAIYDAAAGRVLAEVYEVPGRGHAEILFGQIEQVVGESGVALSNADRFAVTVGPGTFTGVRIALAAARGLALAASKPLIGIGSLEAIAVGCDAGAGTLLAVAVDARRDEVYLQTFAGGAALGAPKVAAVAAAPAALDAIAAGRAIVLAGSGAALLAEACHQAGVKAKTSAAEPWPRASHVARLAVKREVPSQMPSPFYLRAPDAKLPATEASP